MARKYIAPEFAGGRAPRRTGATPAAKRRKIGSHNPIPLPPRPVDSTDVTDETGR